MSSLLKADYQSLPVSLGHVNHGINGGLRFRSRSSGVGKQLILVLDRPKHLERFTVITDNYLLFGKKGRILFKDGKYHIIIGNHSYPKGGADCIIGGKKIFDRQYLIYKKNNKVFAVNEQGKLMGILFGQGCDDDGENSLRPCYFGDKSYVMFRRGRGEYMQDIFGQEPEFIKGGVDRIYRTIMINDREFLMYKKHGKLYLKDPNGSGLNRDLADGVDKIILDVMYNGESMVKYVKDGRTFYANKHGNVFK